MKIFRGLIWLMQGVMRAGHRVIMKKMGNKMNEDWSGFA